VCSKITGLAIHEQPNRGDREGFFNTPAASQRWPRCARLIAPRQCRPPHRSLFADKSIVAPNRWFGFHSIAVLRIGATPGTEFLFAFGEKPDATRTSDATQTVGDSSASPAITCASRRLFPCEKGHQHRIRWSSFTFTRTAFTRNAAINSEPITASGP